MLLADFDPGVTAIAAQPFLLRAQAGGRLRRHVPDFLLVRADHTVQVVNVKPAARLADPAVAEGAGYRRPGIPPDDAASAVLGEARPGERLGGLLDRLERAWPRPAAKAAVLRLLWQQRLSTDPSRPLDAGSVLEVTR